MTIENAYNPPSAGRESYDQNSGENTENTATRIKNLNHCVNSAVIGAAVYTASGIWESFIIPTIPGDVASMLIDSAFVLIIAGIPALIFALRRGFITPIILMLIAMTNMLGCLTAWLDGDERYGPSSVLFNLFFLAVFLVGAFSSFRLSRSAS